MKNLFLLFTLSFSVMFLNAQTKPEVKATATPASTAKMDKSADKMDKSATKMDKSAAKAEKAADAKPMVDMNTKEHVCTAACKDGNHVFAHGEKGHKCTAACHAKKSKSHKAKHAMKTTPAPTEKKG